jgi:RHS repeat-associated protein
MLGGDGIRTEYAYDRQHRLTNLVKKTAAGAMLLAMQYTVDASGMRSAVTEQDALGTTRTVEWSYDATKRLTREAIDHRDTDKDRISAWTYDRVGNRLTQTVTIGASTTESTTYVYDANDRLLSETRTGGSQPGATASTYDANGNTRSKRGPSGVTSYRYDDANRLVEAVTPEGTSSYVYTADGLRVRQAHTPQGGTATTTWYVQDTAYPYAQVIEEYTSQGSGAKQLAATFTFADELVSQTRYANSADALTPTTQFIQTDGFGSTRWLTNSAGAITDKVDYDAFGNEVSRTGSTDIEHLYRGEAFDPNVGFYYLRARWMDPSVGRFVTQDTYMGNGSDPATLNKYMYANGNPVMGIDPSGNATLIEVNFTVGQVQNQRQVNTQYQLRNMRRFVANMCAAAAAGCRGGNNAYAKLKKTLSGSGAQAHHVIQNAVMTGLFDTYKRSIGFSIALLGGSTSRGSPHDIANTIQRVLRGKEPTYVAFVALRGAGCRNADATEIVLAAKNFHELQGWVP